MPSDLILDSRIRTWVFFPIVLVTFLAGIVRHYTSLCLSDQTEKDLTQVRDSQIIIRSRMLRRNFKYIPKSAFLVRREAFNKDKTGFLTEPRPDIQKSMIDPCFISSATDAIKGNFTIVLPAVFIGGWINWVLSGFVTTKIPFPLTYHFRFMLQRDIELMELDPSWVSSASWYFLNVFGMKNIFSLVLGQDNAADENTHMETQINRASGLLSNDMKMLFKAEWEGLEIIKHEWALEQFGKDQTTKSCDPGFCALQFEH